MRVEPPSIPPMPEVPATLTDFLRRQQMWANRQLTYKVAIDEAINGLLVISPSGNVFKIGVSDTGTVTTTQIALGSHP